MAIDFPASPTNGQTFTSGSVTYTYDGTKWTAVAAGGGGSSGTPEKIEKGNTKAEVTDTGTDGAFVVTTEGTPRATVDKDGRVLVGTSSITGASYNSYYARAVVAGNPYNNTFGRLLIRTNTAVASLSSGNLIGDIYFSESGGGDFASIKAEVDATPGTNDFPGRLVFSTTADGASSPTERMRISQTGETRFLSAIGNNVSYFASANNAGTDYRLIWGGHSAASITGGTNSFIVWNNGNVQNTNNSYSALSDIKLKENIVDAGSQWDDIKALQVRNYNLKEGQTHRQIGLIAQEVEPISPGLVYESPDRDEDGNDLGTVTKSVNYSVLYMKAVKALQEAMERIEVLEQRLTDAGIA